MNYRPTSHRAGFTLVELLIGMALLAVVLAATLQIFTSSADGTTRLNNLSDSQQEALNGLQFVSGRLKEAWYVYPAGTVIDLGVNALAKNPVTGANAGSTRYAVGTEPMLAMILPPADRTLSCAASPSGCYRFYAYFAVKHSDWTAAATGFNDPGPATGTQTTWVLAEYRANFSGTPSIVNGGAVPTVPTGQASTNLFMTNVAPALGTTAPNYRLFTLSTVTLSSPGATQLTNWPLTHVNQVRQELRVLRQQGSGVQALPSTTSTYQLTIFPENIGRSGF